MRFASSNRATPKRIEAAAINQITTCGTKMISTPAAKKSSPGTMRNAPKDVFSIIPVHVLAIGHIGIGGVSAIISSICIATTAMAAVFFVLLVQRYLLRRSGPHLLWWAAGVFAYGLGTALEATITLNGNSIALTKSWYIAGALLGGYPLAQGTVYLLLPRRTAHVLTAVTVPYIVVMAVLVRSRISRVTGIIILCVQLRCCKYLRQT